MAYPAIVPYKPRNPKTRLSCILDQEEREAFSVAMLKEVILAIRTAGLIPTIISTDPFTLPETPVVVSNKGLNEALNEVLERMTTPLLILMADIPLADPQVISRIVSSTADIVLVPGRGGGTNAIFMKDPSRFRVDYYGGSFMKHLRIAHERGLAVEIGDSFRISSDIDEKEDLVELMIHGDGKARDFLVDKGFHISTEKGRVTIVRDSAPSGDR